MARTPLVSRSPRQPPAPAAGQATAAADAAAAAAPAAPAKAAAPPPAPAARWWQGHERRLWLLGALLLAVVAGWPAWTLQVKPPLRLAQIDAALRESLVKEPLPAAAAAAYAAVIPSVVRVIGEQRRAPETRPRTARRAASSPASPEGDNEEGHSVGTGVVIVDNGLILTNLHVVAGAERIRVTFFDGSESDAVLVNLQPENDLAVLQALTIPDDLHAATMRSTNGLAPGEAVLAVGFPFGIGPSASQGVVSGLKREFRSPEGKRVLTNLIQFDAAANPGNSGGPLVTDQGEVVGIVTAILNPTQQRFFVGIGFAVPIENAAAGAGMPPF